MFGKKKSKKFGKLKYTYGRTPDIGNGSKKSRKRLTFHAKTSDIGKKFKFWTILLILIVGSAYLVYFLFLSNYFTFTKTEVILEGLEEKSTIFNKYLAELKGKNLILINTEKIRSSIQKDHPKFENIKVIKVYPETIHIEADKYPLVANIINIIGDTQEKHIVNQIGISVQQNAENPNLKYIKIKSEKPLDATNPLLPKEKLEYTLSAIDYFEEKFGMKIFDAEYLEKAREIHLRTEKYFHIWLDIEKSYEDQLGKLKKIVPKLDIVNTPLLYIDLRISGASGNKIIYKRR